MSGDMWVNLGAVKELIGVALPSYWEWILTGALDELVVRSRPASSFREIAWFTADVIDRADALGAVVRLRLQLRSLMVESNR